MMLGTTNIKRTIWLRVKVCKLRRQYLCPLWETYVRCQSIFTYLL